MKCETCFWFNDYQAMCEFATKPFPKTMNERCANWTFNGKPACKDCRYWDRGFCVLEVPAATQYSEQREPDEWCGQFKGRMG
jgi:hypothetical protein